MNEASFFIAGDVLPANTRSYVPRPADQDLSSGVLDGAFCYVLAARQMGKSSLMVRTASRLRERGIRIAQVDLRTVRSASISEWYLDLLVRVQYDLGLKTDARAWWRARTGLDASQRFIDFLHDVALKEIAGAIVLFIDEIDAMLALDFRDEFFAAIRALYNARESDPAYQRLTFVLLGVATPTDLIRDPRRTPFNIGRAIKLQEFTYDDAEPLRQGLEWRYPTQADRILRRIFYWTNGHPYLTQKLCKAAAETQNVITWDDAQVDALVKANFFGAPADRDPNLTFVRSKVLGAPEAERRQMLELYSAVYSGQNIVADESSPVQNHLELYGLVRIAKGTPLDKDKLAVRNEIYRRVFDRKWIEKHAPSSSGTRPIFSKTSLLFALIAVLVAVSAGGAYALVRGQSNTTTATPTAIVAAQATGTGEQIAIATATTASRLSPTIAPPQPTAALPTAIPPTEAPTAIPPTDAPTEAPTEAPTAIPPTEAPTEAPTAIRPTEIPPTAVPPTAVAPTKPPTAVPPVGGASCTVISGATIHIRPSDNTNIGSLTRGETFAPEAKSSDDTTFVWVRISATASHSAGWVYAGKAPRLVACTGLEHVLVETP